MSTRDHHMAWLLADALAHHLPGVDRDAVFVELGSGDTWSAITMLLTAAVRDGLALTENVAAEFSAWLDLHTGGLDEPPVRDLLGRVRRCPVVES